MEALTGTKFGDLTVQELLDGSGAAAVWKCQCTCGKVEFVMARRLKSGETTACRTCAPKPRKPRASASPPKPQAPPTPTPRKRGTKASAFVQHRGKVMSKAEAARELGVTPTTIDRWARTGKLTPVDPPCPR